MPFVGKLSVREKPVGGDVAPSVQLSGAAIDGKGDIVLFIHGYNNSAAEADSSFTTFSGGLDALSAGTSFTVYGFYWPGDTHLKLISALSYPVELSPAKTSADRLVQFLSGLSGPAGTPMIIRVVTHSLGGRVFLEFLKKFSGLTSKVIFQAVSMMAAAVPVGKIKDPKEFGQIVADIKTNILFSMQDRVLQLAFPLGETAAADAFFPEAVGRKGNPGPWNRSIQMNYGHSDYWKGPESINEVGAFMGAPIHPLPSANAIGDRARLSASDIPSNVINMRALLPPPI